MRRLSAVLGLLLFGALAPGAVAAPPPECPTPATTMSIAEVKTLSDGPTGFHATGWTVSRGTEPEAFDVQVLGVLEGGVAAGVDMIMVEASGPAVDKAGGIWAGMSGSPVYSDDGKFIGAVAYGLSFGPSKIGGLAAAGDMVDVLDGNLAPAANLRRVPAALRQEMVATGAVTARQAASGVERLRTPLAVSGLATGRLNAFANRLTGHERFIPFVAGAAVAPPAPGDPAEIVPGGNFAAALSYGEITAAGVGTTTLVCDDLVSGKRKAVAFGHPFNFDGPTALSVHTADAILIQDDPLGAPFKLANIGGTVGTLDQDRLSGIRAILGPAPSPVLVSSRVNQPSTAAPHETRVNRTQEVPDVAAFHLISNIDGEIDRISGGTSTVDWTVTGSAGGRQFSLSRHNQFADPFDISFSTPDEMFFMLASIAQNPFVDVTFDDVKIGATVGFPWREYRITGVEQRVGGDWEPIEGSITAAPGATLRFRVRLAQDRSTTPIAPVEFSLKVPATASGEGSLDIAGGSGGGGGEEGVAVTESGEPETFDELLDMIRKTPQNNQIVATLTFFGGGEGGEGGGDAPAVPPVTQTKDAAEVVSGGASISVSIPGEEPSCGETEPCEEPGSGPTLNLGGKPAARLSTALKHGLKLTLRTSEAGRATVKALVDRKTAKRLKIKRVVATAGKRVHAGRNTVKLVFTKKARKRLKHAKRVKLGIRATIRSVEGNTATDRFNLTLKRKLR